MSESRQAQQAHGFKKLTPVVTDGGLWRRCLAGEQPHGIVSRVNGLDTFTITTNGEIDGLTGLSAGATYGVSPTFELEINGSPSVGKATSTTSLLINLASFSSATASTASSAQLFSLQSTVASLVTTVATNNTANVATDNAQQTQIDALTVSVSSLTNVKAQSRAYAWSVAS